MRDAWFVASRDLVHTLRARETLLWTFVMPIVFFYFIGTVTAGFKSGMGGADTIAVRVGKDAGFLADALVARLGERGFRVVRPDEDPEARRAFESFGRRLEIPDGFTAAALAGKQAQARLVRDASGIDADYVDYRVRRATFTLLADLLAARAASATGAVTAEDVERVHGAERKVTIDEKRAGKRRDAPVGFEQAVPGTMVMFTMLVLLTGGAAGVVIERRQGILRRLAAAPLSRRVVVLGKWASKLGLALVQIAFALVAGRLLFGVTWGPHLPMVLVVLVAYASFMASLGLLLGSVARTEGQAVGFGVLSANVFGALGGCWWPIEVASPMLQTLSHFLPTGWAMDALHRLVSFGAPPIEALPHAAGLAFGAWVLGMLCARFFRYD